MRNPKRDPEAGDLLYKAGGFRRVTRVDGVTVFYETRTKTGRSCFISSWRVWAGSATLSPSPESAPADDRVALLEARVSRLEEILGLGSGPGIGINGL